MKRTTLMVLSAVTLLTAVSFDADAQWMQLGIPDDTTGPGPGISSLYVTNCELFAGTDHGLFMSTDGCKTWTKADSIKADLKIVALVQNNSSVFAVTATGGSYHSEDNGATWYKTNAFDSILCIAKNDSCILAGTTRGIQQCGLNDSVWTWVDFSFPGTGIAAIAAHDSMVFAGGYYSGAFRSSDYGKTWSLLDTSSLPAAIITSFVLCGDTVFASLLSGGVYRSTDNGIRWARCGGLSASGYGGLAVIDSTVFVVADGKIYSTTDYGVTWFPAGSGLENKQVTTLFTAGTELYVGTRLDGIWHRSVLDILAPVMEGNIRRPQPQSTDFRITFSNLADFRTTISFTLPAPMQAKVTIFDMRGREAISPVNGYFSTGAHSIPWNTRQLVSGFYAAKMYTGTSVQMANGILIKK